MLSGAILKRTKVLHRHKESLKHIAILFSGKAGVQLIGLLSQPVLARLYSPSHFGEFAVLNSILALLLVASSGRYESGIILTRNTNQAKRLFQLCQLFLISYFLLLCVILLLYPKALQSWITEQGLPGAYIWLIPLMLLFMGYWKILENWLLRFRKYKQLSAALFFQRIAIFAGAFLITFIPTHANGLIIAQIIGVTGIFVYALFLHKEPLHAPLKSIQSYAYSFREFPYYSVPSLFILLLIYHLPILLINTFFDQELTGHYNMAFTLIMLPLTALTLGAGDVYYERLVKSNYQRQLIMIKNSFYIVTITLLPASLIIFLWGESLTIYLLGPKWQQAGHIATLLSPFVLFQGLCSCLTIPLNIYRKQSLALFFQILKLSFWILAFVPAIFFNDLFLSFKLVSVLSFVHLVITAIIMVPIIKRRHAPGFESHN